MAISIARLQREDFEAFSRLARDSSGRGSLSFSPEYVEFPDDADRALGLDGETYAAHVDGTLVGAAKIAFDRVQYEGHIRPAALLGGLVVHPRHRRQGIAAALTRHRVARAAERCGPDALLVANLSQGHAASLAATASWQTAESRPFARATVRLSPNARTPDGPWTVRPAGLDDLEEVAARLTQFWGSANFHRPRSAQQLAAWVSGAPQGAAPGAASAPRVYLVSEDPSGRIVAGLGITYLYQYLAISVVALPLWMRVANRVVHALPDDRVIRPAAVDLVFLDPEDLGPAQHLWDTVKQQWAREATSLVLSFDPTGPLAPLAQAVRIRSGTMMQTAIRAGEPPDPSRPLAPWVL